MFGLNSASDGYNVIISPRAKASRSSCASADTTRSPSTSPSCCSAAAASSAARSSCGVPSDRGRRRERGARPPRSSPSRTSRTTDHPLPVNIARGEGAWVDGCRGQALPRPARRVLGRELRAPASGARGRAHRAARPGHARQPRVPERPARAVRRGARGACRQRPRVADEHRRRGGRDRHQGRRAWGYRVKGIAAGKARIIVAAGNFHGRTTTIVSFSDDEQARDDFGPYTPGFDVVRTATRRPSPRPSPRTRPPCTSSPSRVRPAS